MVETDEFLVASHFPDNFQDFSTFLEHEQILYHYLFAVLIGQPLQKKPKAALFQIGSG